MVNDAQHGLQRNTSKWPKRRPSTVGISLRDSKPNPSFKRNPSGAALQHPATQFAVPVLAGTYLTPRLGFMPGSARARNVCDKMGARCCLGSATPTLTHGGQAPRRRHARRGPLGCGLRLGQVRGAAGAAQGPRAGGVVFPPDPPPRRGVRPSSRARPFAAPACGPTGDRSLRPSMGCARRATEGFSFLLTRRPR